MANGADVANLSFGGSFGLSSGFEDAIQAIVDAGVVVVAAAGNEGFDNDLIPFYPASFEIDGLIAVAASNDDDLMASFSNYGAISVDLAAPGQDVVGGAPTPDDFAVGSGTSFAAPHVTGVVALVKAMRPDLDPPEVADLVLQSVEIGFRPSPAAWPPVGDSTPALRWYKLMHRSQSRSLALGPARCHSRCS